MSELTPIRIYDITPTESYIEQSISNESLSDGIAFIQDLVGHTVRTIGVNLSSINKEYLHSDYHEFGSRNRARLALFFRDPTRILFPETFIPMPDGMVGKYVDVVNTLYPLISLDFTGILKRIINVTNSITKMLRDNDRDFKTLLDDIANTVKSGKFSEAIEISKSVRDTLPTYFLKGRATASTVGKQFNNKDELKLICKMLSDCSPAYKDFIHSRSNITLMENAFKQLSKAVAEYERSLPQKEKTFLSTVLYTYTKEIALFCDYYGVALHELLRVEHKFILSMTQIMKVART